jgi:uncharacterized repeat protein (TIGR03803 family)
MPGSGSARSVARGEREKGRVMTRKLFAAAALCSLLFLGSAATSAGTSLSVLHSFAGPEGQTPAAPLVQGSDGFLYGVARYGGDFTVMAPHGGGTIFRTDRAGNLTTLHVFNGEDGAVPTGLVQGRDGMFYGTTTYGGVPSPDALNSGPGTIFRIDAAGNFTRLIVLPGWENGYRPGPIMQGADGALYGTAIGGSSVYYRFPGIVYRFDPVTRVYRILHTFVFTDAGFYDGRDPTGRLFQASDGFFYGTTNEGGPSRSGTVYKVDATGNFAVVHNFDFNDGYQPKAGVFQAADGFFYGTTEGGAGGYGEIFRMDAAGNLTVLHVFGPYSAGGLRPATNPVEVAPGSFFGVTPVGGTVNAGYGIVYRMDTSGSTSVVHEFGGLDGIAPSATPLKANDGLLYGPTTVGGANGLGTLYRIDPAQPAALPTLLSLYLDPWAVTGGSTATGTVSLSWAAPAGGAVVALTSSSHVASVPASVTVPQGATRASFTITTKRVKRASSATIVASYNGSVASATLGVTR